MDDRDVIAYLRKRQEELALEALYASSDVARAALMAAGAELQRDIDRLLQQAAA